MGDGLNDVVTDAPRCRVSKYDSTMPAERLIELCDEFGMAESNRHRLVSRGGLRVRSQTTASGLLGMLLLTACLATGGGLAASEPRASSTAADTPRVTMAQDGSTSDNTREVVRRHLKTFGAGDLEGVLADYADDAVMFTPNGPIEGKEALRSAFAKMIAEWGQPGTVFKLQEERYNGEHGYIVWTAETAANVYELGMDGFVVRDGKIAAQFFGAKATPKK